MTPASPFMTEMYNSAQNPQASGGTDWTLMASDKDIFAGVNSAMYMDGGHKSYFQCKNNVGCYDHGGMMNGEGSAADNNDATIQWCDGACSQDPHPGSLPWNTWGAAPRALHHMMYALWLSSW